MKTTRIRPWLVLAAVCLSFALVAGCIRKVDTGARPSGEKALAGEAAVGDAQEPVPSFSAPAFLDRSLYILDRELFYTRDGMMLRDALFFPSPEQELIFIARFSLDTPERQPGKLYLVMANDPETTYELKEEHKVLSIHRAPDEPVVYFETVEESPSTDTVGFETPTLEPPQLEQPSAPAAQRQLKLHRLTAGGKEEVLDITGRRVEQVLADGRMVLSKVRDITSFYGTYLVTTEDTATLYDTKKGEASLDFDYLPLLTPQAERSLRVVTNYDPSDYENSFFALYSGGLSAKRNELTLSFTCPLFLTFTEERWQPVVRFIDERRLFLSRFQEEAAPEGSPQFIPHTTGEISLGIFNLITREFTPVIPQASPYLRVFYRSGESVFFYIYYDLVGPSRTYYVYASTLDGTVTRELFTRSGAQRMTLSDLDIERGYILLAESYETASESFSLLRELRLSEQPEPTVEEAPEPAEGAEGAEGADGESPPPQEQFSSPPPIRLPLGSA